MRTFGEIYDIALKRKGSVDIIEAHVRKPKSPRSLKRVSDDRWLSAMTKSVFQAGFNWKVVENKWDGFEEAYAGFNPAYVAAMSDEQCEQLLQDTRIIRQWRKIKATRHNAQFLCDLAHEHGTASAFFAASPAERYVELLATLKKRAAWLGGTTAQYFLRVMGKDAYILSRDVEAALRREQVFSGGINTKDAQARIQGAFNTWVEQGGDSLNRVSRVLAQSIDSGS